MVTASRIADRKSRAVNRLRAREMRHAPVSAEKLFWNEVRDRRLGGHKFRRQYLIGPFVVDFVCVEKKLIVELDGVLHADRPNYDKERDEFLEAQGYRVMRFRNEELAGDVAATLTVIQYALETPSPRPSPPLRRGEGEE